jgi:hypothetical protein
MTHTEIVGSCKRQAACRLNHLPLWEFGQCHAAKAARSSRTAGIRSADPADGGAGSYGTGNLGYLIHYLNQVIKLISRRIGADLG